MEEFKDKTLTCIDCGKDFIFTAGEQAFYKEKKLTNDPKRCKECREKKKLRRENQQNNEE